MSDGVQPGGLQNLPWVWVNQNSILSLLKHPSGHPPRRAHIKPLEQRQVTIRQIPRLAAKQEYFLDFYFIEKATDPRGGILNKKHTRGSCPALQWLEKVDPYRLRICISKGNKPTKTFKYLHPFQLHAICGDFSPNAAIEATTASCCTLHAANIWRYLLFSCPWLNWLCVTYRPHKLYFRGHPIAVMQTRLLGWRITKWRQRLCSLAALPIQPGKGK